MFQPEYLPQELRPTELSETLHYAWNYVINKAMRQNITIYNLGQRLLNSCNDKMPDNYKVTGVKCVPRATRGELSYYTPYRWSVDEYGANFRFDLEVDGKPYYFLSIVDWDKPNEPFYCVFCNKRLYDIDTEGNFTGIAETSHIQGVTVVHPTSGDGPAIDRVLFSHNKLGVMTHTTFDMFNIHYRINQVNNSSYSSVIDTVMQLRALMMADSNLFVEFELKGVTTNYISAVIEIEFVIDSDSDEGKRLRDMMKVVVNDKEIAVIVGKYIYRKSRD